MFESCRARPREGDRRGRSHVHVERKGFVKTNADICKPQIRYQKTEILYVQTGRSWNTLLLRPWTQFRWVVGGHVFLFFIKRYDTHKVKSVTPKAVSSPIQLYHNRKPGHGSCTHASHAASHAVGCPVLTTSVLPTMYGSSSQWRLVTDSHPCALSG